MINLIDRLLQRVLVSGVSGLTDNEIGFQPPNDDWRQQVGLAQRPSVNVYLVDIVENRRLRGQDPLRGAVGFEVRETQPALRVDLHYLISAWSPALQNQPVGATLDEHQLLGEVTAAFAAVDRLSFAAVFAGVPLPVGTPAALVEHELPHALLPVEGYGRLEEFWGTMGETAPLRPVVYLVVTCPFFETPRAIGPMVRTLIADYRQIGVAVGDVLHDIGGFVRNSAAPLPDGSGVPVADAWVELRTTTGRRLGLVRTDAEGMFQFSRLAAETYLLAVTDQSLGIIARSVSIPEASGSYDLVF